MLSLLYLISNHLETYLNSLYSSFSQIFSTPWYLGGKESTCQCKKHEFDPWSREIPHVTEQLRLCTVTTEACSKASALQQAPSYCGEEPLLPAAREKPAQQQRPSAATRKQVH